MDAPAISVVIPTYNRRKLVAEAVAAVLAQTREDFELIVVDDGSTDDTAAVLERQLKGEARARVLRQENGGTASARNRGIEAARAPWMAFLDSDDLWEPGYLASQLASLADHPGADLVVADATYVNQGRKAETLFGDPHFRAPTSLAAMCAGAWALPSAMVVRTEMARAVRFTNRYRIVEDTEFLLRCHAHGYRCILNPDRLVIWRRPDGEGAAAKSEAQLALRSEMLALLEANRNLAPDPAAVGRDLYNRHRAIAKERIRQGLLGEARPHLRAWCRERPFRLRLRLYYLGSLFARERR